MWVSRVIGAIRVYSIVPSHRFQAIISLMLSKMMARKRQTIVPMSR